MLAGMGLGLLVILAVVVILAAWVIRLYNSLVQIKLKTDNAWSDMDVQLKRRYDLIPNLVSTVQGYAAHEKNTLEAVVQARSKAMSATSAAEKGQAENFLTGALKSLFALAENYPQLKANENFLKLQGSLSETEEAIQASRRYYNAVVRDYNTQIEVFPNNVFAGALNFKPREFFQVDSEVERKAPEVKF